MEQTSRVFDQNQPQLDKYSGMSFDTYGRLAPGAEAGIVGSQNLVNKTVNGDFLQGNPYLDNILAKTRQNTINAVDSQFSRAGRYGSGSHADILARAIADAENQARYNNYASERQNQIGAIGQAQQLMGGSQSLLNNAADLPWIGVGALNGNIRQASNGYGTSKTTSSPSLASILAQAAANAAQAYAAGG